MMKSFWSDLVMASGAILQRVKAQSMFGGWLSATTPLNFNSVLVTLTEF